MEYSCAKHKKQQQENLNAPFECPLFQCARVQKESLQKQIQMHLNGPVPSNNGKSWSGEKVSVGRCLLNSSLEWKAKPEIGDWPHILVCCKQMLSCCQLQWVISFAKRGNDGNTFDNFVHTKGNQAFYMFFFSTGSNRCNFFAGVHFVSTNRRGINKQRGWRSIKAHKKPSTFVRSMNNS